MKIDPKYEIRTDVLPNGTITKIVNPAGVPIPEDEPLILFRARDRHALRALCYYRTLCAADGCTDFHMRGIDNRIAAFAAFRESHPERMKQPGVTEGK